MRVTRIFTSPIIIALVVLGCRRSQPKAAAAPIIAPLDFTTITLERRPCFGTCPVYKVSVDAAGLVTFEGIRFVDSLGKHTANVGVDGAAELKQYLDQRRFTELADKYTYQSPNCTSYATDASGTITTLVTPKLTKRVEYDHGCTGVPGALGQIERRIDEALSTSRWIGR